MAIGDHREKVVFVVTDIGDEDVIIGLDWLREHNPEVDWKRGLLRLSRCPEACPAHQKASKPVETKARDTEGKEGKDATYTYSQQLAEQEYQKKEIRPVEEIVPEQYHEYLRVFSKEASECLPDHGPYDRTIELVPDARMFYSKVYPLSPSEQVELDKFINENLAKGYIQESKSPMSSPFFFVKKKDGSLRPVQDYRRLNDITIKNQYPLPLVSDLMDRLKKAKYFTKLDICWGYNNVRIKTSDEWKAAFVTNRGLFEPNVMFFGLANSPSTFSGGCGAGRCRVWHTLSLPAANQ
ncbi:hypothetical protein GSI_10385 [Ganoderma sinense ZZ0214-1]|uniref:Reverse transcriptase domain-containing protein n=1 Tax=Ganoderma sinense ZZ0214-1 TaxID=1077348 RepID=A0A2G8S0F4_9APHY|nr:hypothetical protein GSI_10385 [Ganoderma sinense ZZ0214-1]